jgi:hypothetical protein
MPRISKPVLAEAIQAVSTMTTPEKESLVDEIHRIQPNLLMAVLAQHRLGASFERVEVLLTILLSATGPCAEAASTGP